jgi:hypothetical protein
VRTSYVLVKAAVPIERTATGDAPRQFPPVAAVARARTNPFNLAFGDLLELNRLPPVPSEIRAVVDWEAVLCSPAIGAIEMYQVQKLPFSGGANTPISASSGGRGGKLRGCVGKDCLRDFFAQL